MTNRNNSLNRDNAHIHAVVLDYGEVLCLRPDQQILDRMAQVFYLDPAKFFDLYVSSRGPYDQGTLTAEEYWLDFSRGCGVQVNPGAVEQLRRWDTEMWSRIDPEMTGWLARLNDAGLTTALLSNMEHDMAVYARENFRWLAHFHHVLFSCELGLIKPDPAIFRECLRRVNWPPEETLFVDDRQDNIAAASAAGMTSIRFQSIPQLRAELSKIGFDILPGDSRREQAL